MNNYIINSAALPNIGEPTKKMINQGIWFLFKINYKDHENIEFALIVDENIHFLDHVGNTLFAKNSRPRNVQFDSAVYFEDLPAPGSVSNYQFA